MAVFNSTFFSNSLHRFTQLTAIIPIEEPYLSKLEKRDKSQPLRSLYLLHGFFGCHMDWIYNSRIEQYATAHNIAVFCPSCENSFYLDDRITNTLYEQFISQELIAFTRDVFRISDARKDTSIGGLSMGGYGALRNGLKHPDVFANIIALSSGLITDRVAEGLEQYNSPIMPESFYLHVFGKAEDIKGSDIDPKELARRLVDQKCQAPNIYMRCGTEDPLLPANNSLSDYMTEIGLEHNYMVCPGMHDWAFWDEHIEKALTWLDSFA